jgi:hypothetical protein
MQRRLIDFNDDWGRLVDIAYNSYPLLTPDERIWYNVQGLMQDIANGGLISYYYNYGADHLYETMADLQTIGAGKIIELLQKINELFPDGIPGSDINERNNVISNWEDGAIDDLLRNLDDGYFKEQEQSLENILVEYILAKGLIPVS